MIASITIVIRSSTSVKPSSFVRFAFIDQNFFPVGRVYGELPSMPPTESLRTGDAV
jgi:hypothetical protein